jgi:hypothetical protein
MWRPLSVFPLLLLLAMVHASLPANITLRWLNQSAGLVELTVGSLDPPLVFTSPALVPELPALPTGFWPSRLVRHTLRLVDGTAALVELTWAGAVQLYVPSWSAGTRQSVGWRAPQIIRYLTLAPETRYDTYALDPAVWDHALPLFTRTVPATGALCGPDYVLQLGLWCWTVAGWEQTTNLTLRGAPKGFAHTEVFVESHDVRAAARLDVANGEVRVWAPRGLPFGGQWYSNTLYGEVGVTLCSV